MNTCKLKDIMRLWSRASIRNQHKLIRRFQEINGQKNMCQDIWMKFLAEEFSVPDYNLQHLQN